MSPAAHPSPLGTVITAYVDRQRSLGFQYDNEARILQALDAFLAERDHSELTAASFNGWALTLEHLTPQGRRKKMRIVYRFTLHRRHTAPECFVPNPSLFPSPAPAPDPWIFSEHQILALLQQAGQLQPAPHSPLRAHVYRLAVVLLYTAGLRRGELLRLRIGDYDPCRHTLLVRVSKFRKSRIVALSRDAWREMDTYLRLRLGSPHTADSPLLAHGSRADKAFSGSTFGNGFRKLCRDASVLTDSGRPPRVHDLRHTYAAHVLLRCYRDNRNPQAVLPILSRAMGHVSLASTAYYLALIDPVLEQAAQQVARRLGTLLAGNPGGSDV